MKAYLSIALLALSLMFPAVVRADHTVPEGAVARLHEDTHLLEYNVRNSSLRYSVKQSVYRLSTDVSEFYQCANRGLSRDHTIPEICENVMRQVRSSWYPVERYLYDTAFDYPWVFRSYQQVRSDLQLFPF